MRYAPTIIAVMLVIPPQSLKQDEDAILRHLASLSGYQHSFLVIEAYCILSKVSSENKFDSTLRPM